MKDTRVTVLMPAYNAAKYIGEAIQSVLDQTFTDFELLIINDGSTDETETVIEEFGDLRIRVLDQHNQGICVALNRGLHEAAGEYIARFDADDICFPDRLEKQVAFLDSHPDYILTGCDAEYVDESGEHLFNFECAGHTHEEIIAQIYQHCPFIHSGVMYKRKEVLEAGGYSTEAYNFEDYFLWVKMVGLGRFCNLPEQLIKVRFNPGSATMDERWRGRRFRELKKNILHRGIITTEESEELLSIIRSQDVHKRKEGAYYALCGKKFLFNNYKPGKARANLVTAIRLYPMRFDNYALYVLSFFPKRFIHWLHRKKQEKAIR